MGNKSRYFTNNTQDRFKIAGYFLLELFKIVIASVLLVSVIQECDGERCSLIDRLMSQNEFTYYVLGMNILNILFLLIMYVFELRRENFIINYFDTTRELLITILSIL